jgi:hypothetical protein
MTHKTHAERKNEKQRYLFSLFFPSQKRNHIKTIALHFNWEKDLFIKTYNSNFRNIFDKISVLHCLFFYQQIFFESM